MIRPPRVRSGSRGTDARSPLAAGEPREGDLAPARPDGRAVAPPRLTCRAAPAGPKPRPMRSARDGRLLASIGPAARRRRRGRIASTTNDIVFSTQMRQNRIEIKKNPHEMMLACPGARRDRRHALDSASGWRAAIARSAPRTARMPRGGRASPPPRPPRRNPPGWPNPGSERRGTTILTPGVPARTPPAAARPGLGSFRAAGRAGDGGRRARVGLGSFRLSSAAVGPARPGRGATGGVVERPGRQIRPERSSARPSPRPGAALSQLGPGLRIGGRLASSRRVVLTHPCRSHEARGRRPRPGSIATRYGDGRCEAIGFVSPAGPVRGRGRGRGSGRSGGRGRALRRRPRNWG